jgi:hypothetical protein
MKRSCIRAGDIRIPEQQQQLVTATPTTYGLGFRRANTFWKAPGVYIHMHQTSFSYRVEAGRSHYFGPNWNPYEAVTTVASRCFPGVREQVEPQLQ